VPSAGVVELVDTPDLGSGGLALWGFESLRPHQEDVSRPDWRHAAPGIVCRDDVLPAQRGVAAFAIK
jgi:hypothetical protein